MSETFITVILAIYSVAAVVAVILIPRHQIKATKLTPDNPEYPKLENELRRTVIQVAGGVGLVFGLFFTWRQLAFNEFAKNGERFTTLVSNLNSDRPTIRYDSIYELAQIAEQDPSRKTEIRDFLCYWLREESKKPTTTAAARAVEFTAVLRFVVGVHDEATTPKSGDGRTDAIDLSGADLEGITISKINLSNVNLSNANLSGSDFTYADLRKTILSGANLENAKLVYANTTGIILDHPKNLRGCNFQGDDLQKVNFSGISLEGVNFSYCKLGGAKMTNSTLAGYSYRFVDFSGADLRGANLKHAYGLKRSQLNSAIVGDTTVLPESIDPEK